MKPIPNLLLVSLLIIFGTVQSSAQEPFEPIHRSTWMAMNRSGTAVDAELYALAYDWGYLIAAHRTALELARELRSAKKAQAIDTTTSLAETKSSQIGSALEEVIMGKCDTTLPLLRKSPDKVLIQELLLHSIRYSGGGNERWEGIVEALCAIRSEWTIEVLRGLNAAEVQRFKRIITGPGETENSPVNKDFLKLLTTATEAEGAAGQAAAALESKP